MRLVCGSLPGGGTCSQVKQADVKVDAKTGAVARNGRRDRWRPHLLRKITSSSPILTHHLTSLPHQGCLVEEHHSRVRIGGALVHVAVSPLWPDSTLHPTLRLYRKQQNESCRLTTFTVDRRPRSKRQSTYDGPTHRVVGSLSLAAYACMDVCTYVPCIRKRILYASGMHGNECA